MELNLAFVFPRTLQDLNSGRARKQRRYVQGNAICIVTFEKGLFGDAKCKSGCECLAETWEQKQAELCTALGDCGPNINWVGQPGYRAGYKKIIEKYKGGK